MSKEKSNGVERTPIEQPKEGTEQVKDRVLEVSSCYNSPKTSQEDWIKIRLEYEKGTWKSLHELGQRYGVHEKTLQSRIRRQKWKVKREAMLSKIEARIEEKTLDLASEYLKKSFERTKRYEKLVDVSQEHFGSKTADGTALLDPDALDSYSKTESRIHEWAKSCLRIIPVSQVDHTSNGESLGQSFISAIAKLREAGAGAPKLSGQDLSRVLEAEVE